MAAITLKTLAALDLAKFIITTFRTTNPFGTEGKTPVLLAVEKRGEGTGFLAVQVMTQGLNQAAVREFFRRNLASGKMHYLH